MADVRTLFRDADTIDAPDLWTEIHQRAGEPDSSGRFNEGLVRAPRPGWERFVAAVAALILAMIAIGVLVRVFGSQEPQLGGGEPILERIPDVEGPIALGVADGSIWVSRFGASSPAGLSRIDPRSGRVVSEITVPGAGALAVSDHAIWVTTESSVVHVDPMTDEIAGEIPLQGVGSATIEAGFGSAWVTEYKGTRIRRIDEVTNAITVLDTGTRWPIGLAVTSDSIWSASLDGTLQRIDPETNEIVDEVDVAAELGSPDVALFGIVTDDHSVWVTVCASFSFDDFGAFRRCTWSLARLDASSGRLLDTIDLGRTVETRTEDGFEASLDSVRAILASDGSVWVAVNDYVFHGKGDPYTIDEGERASTPNSAIIRFDANTGQMIDRLPLGTGVIVAAVADSGFVWLADITHGELIRFGSGD